MKRYLMRAPSGPFDNPTYYDSIYNNLTATNSGNLLFPHSITRAILTEDVEIDYIKTTVNLTEEQYPEINEKYDAFIIPLANAFRESFVGELMSIAELVKALTIPCIVIGVGYQGKLKDKGIKERPFNNTVKHFMEAILEKSDSVGIRGEYTCNYLKSLGFIEDKHFRVIGCPSMYLYGKDLPKPREFTLSKDTKLSINSKATLPENLHLFLQGICDEYPDHYFIPQNDYEQRVLFAGLTIFDYPKKVKPYENYPNDLNHKLYRENRVRSFISAEAWFEFLRGRDLSVGSRIHGNIAAILAGTPAFIIAPDSRVLELAEYHDIPHITLNTIPENTSLASLIEGVDFSRILKGHEERFAKYLDFMRANDLVTIYDDPDYEKTKTCPFDKKISEIDFRGPMIPLPFADYDAVLEATTYLRRRYKDLENRSKDPAAKKSTGERLKKLAKKLWYYS